MISCASNDQRLILTFTSNFWTSENEAAILKHLVELQVYSLTENMLKTAEHRSSQWSNFSESIYVGEQDYSPLAFSLLLYLGWALLPEKNHIQSQNTD